MNRLGVLRAVLIVLFILLAPSGAHAVQTDIPTRIRAYLEGLGAGAAPVIDGHTLNEQLEQAAILMQDSASRPTTAFVDLGYRGVDAHNPDVHIVHRGKAKRAYFGECDRSFRRIVTGGLSDVLSAVSVT